MTTINPVQTPVTPAPAFRAKKSALSKFIKNLNKIELVPLAVKDVEMKTATSASQIPAKTKSEAIEELLPGYLAEVDKVLAYLKKNGAINGYKK